MLCLQCPPPPPISGLLALPPPCRRRRELPPSCPLFITCDFVLEYILLVIVDSSLAFLYFSKYYFRRKPGVKFALSNLTTKCLCLVLVFLYVPLTPPPECVHMPSSPSSFSVFCCGRERTPFWCPPPKSPSSLILPPPLLQHRKAHTSTPKKPWWCSRRLCSGGGWGSIRTKSGFLKK